HHIHTYQSRFIFCFFFSLIPPPPRSTLFPYTTLFRSTPRPRRSRCSRPRSAAPARSPTSAAWSCPTTSAAAAPSCSAATSSATRSEEHTSELQSLAYLVCRLLLEKKKKKTYATTASCI